MLPSLDGKIVLFWGGRSVSVATIEEVLDAATEVVGDEFRAPDWILSAALISRGVVAVGAHNELMIYGERKEWEVIPCDAERTMLYSADIAVGSDGGVTVAAGTVFGEIIVWSWNGEGVGQVKKRLRGHEGSVFAVRFDDKMRWLASCSDDRTVRVWDLLIREADGDGDGERETTGFGEVVGGATGGRGCVGMGWGHQARPWGVRFLPAEAGQVRLISVSEDLTARFWMFTPQPSGTTMMETTKSWLLHQGKSIWAFVIDTEKQLMATGGNDGRVGLLDYSDDVEVHQDWLFQDLVAPPPTLEIPVGEDEPPSEKNEEKLKDKVTKKKEKNKPMDGFKNYAVVDSERFVATTVYGQVMLHNMRDKTWKSLGTWDALVKWSAIRVWEGTAVLAVGDNEGKLGIFDINSNRSWWWDGGGRGKVADVFVSGKDGGAFPCTCPESHCFQHVIEQNHRLLPSYYHVRRGD